MALIVIKSGPKSEHFSKHLAHSASLMRLDPLLCRQRTAAFPAIQCTLEARSIISAFTVRPLSGFPAWRSNSSAAFLSSSIASIIVCSPVLGFSILRVFRFRYIPGGTRDRRAWLTIAVTTAPVVPRIPVLRCEDYVSRCMIRKSQPNSVCGNCKQDMWIDGIIPVANGYDMWSYTCRGCGHHFRMVGPRTIDSASISERRLVARLGVLQFCIPRSGRRNRFVRGPRHLGRWGRPQSDRTRKNTQTVQDRDARGGDTMPLDMARRRIFWRQVSLNARTAAGSRVARMS